MSGYEQHLWQQMLAQSFHPRQWFDDITDKDYEPQEDDIMWVYRKASDGTFEVGFYTPDKEWLVDEVFSSREEARRQVSYLNGGRESTD